MNVIRLNAVLIQLRQGTPHEQKHKFSRGLMHVNSAMNIYIQMCIVVHHFFYKIFTKLSTLYHPFYLPHYFIIYFNILINQYKLVCIIPYYQLNQNQKLLFFIFTLLLIILEIKLYCFFLIFFLYKLFSQIQNEL